MSRHQPYQKLLKRFIDLAGSSLLIALLSPLFVALALLIRVVDGSPVIYRRRVVGPRGEFDAFKFRSMRPDADAVLDTDSTLKQTYSENF